MELFLNDGNTGRYRLTQCLKSSRSQMFFKIGALKHFVNSTGKHLCWNLFLIKLQARPATLLKRDSNTGVSLWTLQKFLQNLFYRTSPVAASDPFITLQGNIMFHCKILKRFLFVYTKTLYLFFVFQCK